MSASTHEEIHAHTKFGLCRACDVWHPRDILLGMNLRAFPGDGDDVRVTIRLCPKCFDEALHGLIGLQWDNRLLTLDELKNEPKAKMAL